MQKKYGEIMRDKEERKYSEKSLSLYYFVHYKSHMDWPGIEFGPPW